MNKPNLPKTSLQVSDLKLDELKDIKGYEGLYQINTNGDIISLPKVGGNLRYSINMSKMLIKKQRITKFGYATITLWCNAKVSHFFIHRLVAIHFIGDAPTKKHTVNHKDGNKLNNDVSNLEWCTVSENLKHAYATGLMSQKGESHASNKLNNVSVLKILNSKLPVKELSKTYGVSEASIYNVKCGETWSHITKKLKK